MFKLIIMFSFVILRWLQKSKSNQISLGTKWGSNKCNVIFWYYAGMEGKLNTNTITIIIRDWAPFQKGLRLITSFTRFAIELRLISIVRLIATLCETGPGGGGLRSLARIFICLIYARKSRLGFVRILLEFFLRKWPLGKLYMECRGPTPSLPLRTLML